MSDQEAKRQKMSCKADPDESRIGRRFKITKIDGDFREARQALIMHQIKLPHATQTHEICYEKGSKAIWVSQMTNSTLVKIGIDDKGMLKDTQEAYLFGWENAGLHNVSPSYKYEGHLWLSLQYMNLLVLVDVVSKKHELKLVKILQVPTFVGKGRHTGGPHCVRECPSGSGHLVVCLKGDLGMADHAADPNPKTIPCGKYSVCCNAENLKKQMEIFKDDPDLDVKMPNCCAVWYVNPDHYNPYAEDRHKGGYLFESNNTPVMACIDNNCNAWIAQDTDEHVMFIDGKTKEVEFLKCPWPKDCEDADKITGPGIAMAPNGDIWFTQFKAMESMVRIDPDTKKMTLYDIAPPSWAKGLRLIHLDFHQPKKPEHHNRIYAISSSFLQVDETDALIIFNMSKDWKNIESYCCIPMPTQKSQIHRITYCRLKNEHDDNDEGSVFITLLSVSKILQVKVNHDFAMTELLSDHVRRYESTETITISK